MNQGWTRFLARWRASPTISLKATVTIRGKPRHVHEALNLTLRAPYKLSCRQDVYLRNSPRDGRRTEHIRRQSDA